MMTNMKIIFLLSCLLFQGGMAFVPTITPQKLIRRSKIAVIHGNSLQSSRSLGGGGGGGGGGDDMASPHLNAVSPHNGHDENASFSLRSSSSVTKRGILPFLTAVSIGLVTFMGTQAMAVADELDEVEIAELPPPYIPVIVAVVLIGGVGVLTGSLGDVMSEEASLGLQSGAKAKKEQERGRSSYFKK